MSVLSGAVETAPVSDLHARGSVNPADFAVPGGREEEWRFTPLRRLRGLHSDAPLTQSGVAVAVEAAPELLVEKVKKTDEVERSGLTAAGAFLPTDRVSARAYAAVTEATVITVPKDTTASAPTYVRVTGTDASVATAGHLVIDVQPYGRATVVIDQRGSATYADNVEIHVGDGGDLVVVALADWAGDTVQVSHHQATLGRDARFTHFAVTLGGSLVRLSPTVRYAGPGGDAELSGIAFADAGQHLEHRLFVDHDTPNCRSRVSYKGALRRRGRAHGLDRRRADPPGGDRHRHLRVQPEPGAVRRRARRLGAEPGDPHRRGDRRGARLRQRPPRRRAHVLPDGARHPVRGRPPTGHQGLLRRAGGQDRNRGAAGPHHVGDRDGAVMSAESTGFVRACALADIPDSGILSVEVDHDEIAIVRTEGEVFAIRDWCSHAAVPLSEGEVDGYTIECWLHNSRFDLRTGKPTGLPATQPVPVYPVKIEGDDVLVAIEES